MSPLKANRKKKKEERKSNKDEIKVYKTIKRQWKDHVTVEGPHPR